MQLSPENSAERLVWYALAGTYGWYLLGALYVVAPVVGWLLLALLLAGGAGWNLVRSLAPLAWLWVAGMGLMLVALIAAHLDFGLGVGSLVKSSLGWAKGWALLALFVLAGRLPIRAALVSRAACVVGAHTLLLAPLFVAAWLLHLPETLYVSPLRLIGGPGPEFFSVSLYGLNPESGAPRWRLFTPWGPALGLIGCIYLVLALEEPARRWRAAGIAGAVLMVLMSGSRLGMLTIPALLAARLFIRRLDRPGTYFAAAAGSLAAGLVAPQITAALGHAISSFHSLRPESSRVRAALARIALRRWQQEAPWWGHGVVERGPHLVEFMPIGSHHTWYGLLFVKGLVGLVALALPLGLTLAAFVVRAARDARDRAPLGVLLVLALFSFGENLEMLAYLFWPGLLAVGIALHRAIPASDADTSRKITCTSN